MLSTNMKLRIYALIFSIILGIFLVLFPNYDIIVSHYFYDVHNGFLYANLFIVNAIFKFIPILSSTLVTALVFGIAIKYFLYGKKEAIKSNLIFLLLALTLGPGLVINGVLKENFGRARPSQVTEFGGTKTFYPAAHYSNECTNNCSFSSGHAAIGFYFTALAMIMPLQYQTLTFFLGFLFGSLVGFGRILQGGHFFSDIVFSFIIIIAINELSFKLWKYMCERLK
jgi:lipid A 4'-phosphatase